jgi:hypothetical protein
MSAMTAHVGEGPERPIGITAEKHAFSSNVDGAKLTRSEEAVEAADADPTRSPEAIELPFEYLRGDVGIGRKGEAVAEGLEHVPDLTMVEWCRFHVDLSYRRRAPSVS